MDDTAAGEVDHTNAEGGAIWDSSRTSNDNSGSRFSGHGPIFVLSSGDGVDLGTQGQNINGLGGRWKAIELIGKSVVAGLAARAIPF